MSSSALVANARWEVQRWIRSQRIFLLLIPPIAGPVGSAIAFTYFHVPDRSTALTLGLFVTGGLSAMVILDLCALLVGEDLARRVHLFHFALPEPRWSILSGRLAMVLGAGLGSYAVGVVGVWALAGLLVPVGGTPMGLMVDPVHGAEGIAALLVFLGMVTVNASVITRSASEALVAGVLAAVVTAAGSGYLLIQGTLTMLLPALLVAVAVVSLGWSIWLFQSLES